MPRRLITLPDFVSVASPGVATVQLPVGAATYEEINLVYRESAALVSVANMKTAITKIELLADNVPLHTYSAEELLAIWEHFGQGAGQAGYLPLPIAPYMTPNLLFQRAAALGTANISNLTLRVTIASGRTAPTLAATAAIRAEARPVGKILQFERLTITPGAANAYHRLLNQENFGRPILGMIGKASTVTRVKYLVGQTSIIDDIEVAELDRMLTAHPVLAPVSGFFIVNFANNGDFGSDPQPIRRDNTPIIDQRLELFCTATTAINAVVMLIGEPRR